MQLYLFKSVDIGALILSHDLLFSFIHKRPELSKVLLYP